LLLVAPGVSLCIQKNIVEIAQECPFVTKTVVEMDNISEHFILYYWYVTNVYLITMLTQLPVQKTGQSFLNALCWQFVSNFQALLTHSTPVPRVVIALQIVGISSLQI
jgi:hypothetical protein